MAAMRVVSLLPAATEIVHLLGLADALVAVSHECDHPVAVRGLPRATRCTIHGNALPSADIDRWVRRALGETGTLYTLDEALLRGLEPDVIITQRLCDVCAVGFETVTDFAATLPGPPAVVNLEPTTIGGVLDDVRRVGEALGIPGRAAVAADALAERLADVRAATNHTARPRCVLLEWVDPPFRCGHWMPELVETAGGEEVLGRVGEPAAEVSWDEVVAAAPEVLVIACCGFDVARTLRDVPALVARPGWSDLPAVRNGRVWAVDGSAYFSRPGPRLVESAEILAGIFHPTRVPPPGSDVAQRIA
jgi:iron complex transport system substrate-binding protein